MTTTPDPYEALACFDPPLPPVLVDRSTIERYCICPFQAFAVETGLVPSGSLAADSGNEAHDAYAAMVVNYIESHGSASTGSLFNVAVESARKSRPDLQPDVLSAVRAGAYQFARDLTYRPDGQQRNPADILRFQGGQGERTGQIAMDILPQTTTRGPVRLTTELDLLMAADARDELAVTDWKTGHTHWTAPMVRESFQFNFQAMILLTVYPDCDRVWIRVFSPRTGGSTGYVGFTRRDAEDCKARCAKAIQVRADAISDPDGPQCWPDAERCCQCDAILKCLKSSDPAGMLAADPKHFLECYALRQLQLEQDGKALAAYAKAHGVIEAAGWAFGPKPPSGRAATYGLREAKAKKADEEREDNHAA